MYTDCLLKNTSTKHNKYVVNEKLENVDDISFRELFGRMNQCFIFYFYKICPFLAHNVFVFTLAILLYETQLNQIPSYVLQLRVRNSCVEGREVKCFNVIAGAEGPRLYVV